MDEDAVRREIHDYLSNNLRIELSVGTEHLGGGYSKTVLTVVLKLPNPYSREYTLEQIASADVTLSEGS